LITVLRIIYKSAIIFPSGGEPEGKGCVLLLPSDGCYQLIRSVVDPDLPLLSVTVTLYVPQPFMTYPI